MDGLNTRLFPESGAICFTMVIWCIKTIDTHRQHLPCVVSAPQFIITEIQMIFCSQEIQNYMLVCTVLCCLVHQYTHADHLGSNHAYIIEYNELN